MSSESCNVVHNDDRYTVGVFKGYNAGVKQQF